MPGPSDNEHVPPLGRQNPGRAVYLENQRAGRVDQLLAGLLEPLPLAIADAMRGDHDQRGGGRPASLLFAGTVKSERMQPRQNRFVVHQLAMNRDGRGPGRPLGRRQRVAHAETETESVCENDLHGRTPRGINFVMQSHQA